MWGENLDLANPNGFFTADEAVRRGITAIRFPMRNGILDAAATYQAAGIYVLGVLDKTSHEQKVWIPDLDAYQIGNEPDVTGAASWTMAAPDYIALVQQYRGNHPHAHLIGAGMASGSTAYLRSVQACWSQLDGYAVHLYGGTWTHARTILRTFKQYTLDLPQHVTEYNPLTDRPHVVLPAWEAMLDQETVMHYHFCATDAMEKGFGLTDTNGQDKPDMRAMMAMR
jgi:hypothetical protein